MISINRRTAIIGAAPLAARLLLPRNASAISAGRYCPSAKERSVLRQLNAYRRKRGRSELKMDRSLGAAARHHANDMSKRRYLDHISPNGDDPIDRARKHGYKGRSIGENIAQGQPTPAAVMKAWKKSADHRRNLLNRKYKAVGIGYDPQGDYWVQVFGDTFFEEPACQR